MPTQTDRLTALRTQLAAQDLDGFVIPLTDEHMSEYVGGYAQRLGWLTGFRGSAGTAVAGALRVAAELGPDDLVVVVLPDSGRNYLSKVHDDAWLRHWGFLDGEGTEPVVGDARTVPLGVRLRPSDTVKQALATLEALEAERPEDDAPVLVATVAERADGVVMAPEVVGAVTTRPPAAFCSLTASA